MSGTQWMTVAVLSAGIASRVIAVTPAQLCEAAKNKEAGKYDSCRQNAESAFAKVGDVGKYSAALAKCLTKYQARWPALEAKALAQGGACPSVGDQAAIQAVIDQHTSNIATALDGGVLQDCPADLLSCQGNLGICNGGLTTCSGNLSTCTSDLGICTTALGTCPGDLTTCLGDLTTCQAAPQGQRLKTGQTLCYDAAGTLIPCAGTGQDGESQKGLARSYIDNGDGTITDDRTGLMWEKLSDDGSIHDKDTAYTWLNAFSIKVASLNSASFAGFTDWRLPNRAELESILDLGATFPSVFAAFNTSCSASCTVLTCSCTQSNTYWSSSTYAFGATAAWSASFLSSNVAPAGKTSNAFVRAVRGGT